jgi:hypothetical protein
MAVEVPVTNSLSASERNNLHEQLLRDSDGLLLYRNSAPERWLYRTVEHVIYAETLSQRQHDSKGFLLTDPSVHSGSPVDLFQRPGTTISGSGVRGTPVMTPEVFAE